MEKQIIWCVPHFITILNHAKITRLQMEAFSALATADFFVGKSPVTGEFPSQRASNADFHVSLVWVHISW